MTTLGGQPTWQHSEGRDVDTCTLEQSPFLDLEHPITLYEAVKLVVLFPLAVIRLVLILFIFTLVWIPCRLYVAFQPSRSRCETAGGGERTLEEDEHPSTEDTLGSAWIDWWVKLGSRCLLFAAGWWYIQVKGRQHISPDIQTTIFVYNHISFSDPVLLLAVLGGHSGVAKASVAELPFAGPISRAIHYIFIQRRNSEQDKHTSHRFAVNTEDAARGPVPADVRSEDLGAEGAAAAVGKGSQQVNTSRAHGATRTNTSSKTASTISQEAVTQRVTKYPGRVLMIAPEGTTKGRDCLLRFRKGAFVPGVPVTPVLLRYPARHFYVGWGVPWNDLFHMWRLLSQVANFAEVEFLEPYVPDAEEQKDATLYAEHVRETMGRHLGVALVDSDVKEENELRQRGVRPNFWATRLSYPV